ncbi:hypothetical protein ACQVTU_33680 [Bacillus cereus]|uniref:hypothetical protein n=1 Tax=Bacillus TaxID=1386 RepID=UPI000F8A1546|nr:MULTISPECIES: hypothetical protein [Bacillus cereus group]AZR80799.1 hypothetical protein BtSCAC15_32440 [Bacillus thuringiensis]MDF9626869.1 hypothetical protein [Bacillus cereus]MED2035045.1 hypothetical protein [Bacillus thuringiensis]
MSLNLNKKLSLICLLFITFSNIILYLSINSELKRTFSNSDFHANSTLSMANFEIILYSIQVYNLIVTLLSVFVCGLILWFVSFLLDSKEKKSKFIIISSIGIAILSIKGIILAIINYLMGNYETLYIFSNNIILQYFDPFIWISTVTVFVLLFKKTDLNKTNSLIISIIYYIILCSSTIIQQIIRTLI